MDKIQCETEKYITWLAGYMCSIGQIEIEDINHFFNEDVPEMANKFITNRIMPNDDIGKYFDKIQKELLIKYGTHEFMINYDFEDDEEIE